MTGTPGTPPADATGNGGGAPSPDAQESTIRRVVSEVLDGLFKGGQADVTDDAPPARRKSRATGASVADQTADIDAQVKAAVQAAKDADKKSAEEQRLLDRIDKLEKEVAAKETPPVEFRKITKLLWGDRT